ncbi:alpha/beta hydrolase [Sinomonas sp. ASV322]|uniref:alpha/beta fold hydrolase n=1 Tax=Sinomonas sp. ASV322 TaxID=3041920 RepID=UPI0027DD4957|nr:alpha/beta hydrolase [Sinomonas sp. ASV322]MDQ4504271.1 alpha/beta hydrolase [Sinomonas sp. ASV322]
METTTSADGTTIAFDRLGAGTPLILVAGATSDRQGSARHAEALARHFTVYNYDRRGRGDSTDTQPFAVDREIEDIAALLDVANAAGTTGSPGGAVVVGFSSGAALAARAAAKLPTRALIMWEPPFAVDDAGLARARDYTDALTARLEAGERDGAFELFLRYVGMPDEAIAGMRQSPYWPGAVRIAPTLAYDNAALAGSVIPTELFARIATPTLVLGGGASPAFLQAGPRAAADAIPGARFAILDGQTHDVDPEMLTTAVHEFVAGLASHAGTVAG